MNVYDQNFVRQYFNYLSENYDAAEKISFHLLQYWRNRILARVSLPLAATVYDIGCGSGNNFAALTRKIGTSGKIIGVDFSNKMMQKAAALIHQNHWTHIELLTCDFIETPAFAQKADTVFGTFCLKTIAPEHYPAFANQTWNVLKPKGICVLGEFSLPKASFVSFLTQQYLKHIVPILNCCMGIPPNAHALLNTYVTQFDGCIALEKAFQAKGFKTKRFILKGGWITGIVAEKAETTCLTSIVSL